MVAGSGADAGSDEFGRFLSENWGRWLAEFPEVATQYGVAGLNDRWTDDSPDGIERRRRLLAESLERVRAFVPKALSAARRLDYELYRETLEAAEHGLRFGDDPSPFRSVVPHNLWMPLNQMEGIHISATETLDLQPKERPGDVTDLLARLASLPRAVDQQIALLRAGAARGFTPPRIAVRGLADQLRGLKPADPAESPLLRPLLEVSDRVDARSREESSARGRDLYTAAVAPAFERLREFVEREYLPACRETVAASALPDGPAAYAHHVRWQTTTTLTPEQIHAVGLAEVERIRRQMEAIARSTGFAGSLREFNEMLRTERRFYFDRPEELIDGYRAVCKRIDPALARLFGRLPRLPYGVLPVPEFRAKSSPSAYYNPGSPAVGRPGYFYANTYDIGKRPRWEMEALALHEAVPGHHLQLSLAQEAATDAQFRRFAGYSAFVEGWGLYAESLGEELGLLADPYSKFGQLTFDMWRSIRLVVDTGMHALGWSRERAIDFFRENTGKSDLDIAVEVDRYIVWPGQALAYKLGQLRFRELRTGAERSLGDRFDVRAFHDRALGSGALPLEILERQIRDWVESGGPPAA